MFVLDTNTLICFFKGMGRVADRFLASSPADIGIPAIVLYELETGIAKLSSPRRRRAQLEQIVSITGVLPFAETEAKLAAEVRSELEKKGRSIGPYDVQIAATALSYHGTLVTHNIREFRRVRGLDVVDWY